MRVSLRRAVSTAAATTLQPLRVSPHPDYVMKSGLLEEVEKNVVGSHMFRRVWLEQGAVSLVCPKDWFCWEKEEPLPVKNFATPFRQLTRVISKEDVSKRGFFDTGLTQWVYTGLQDSSGAAAGKS